MTSKKWGKSFLKTGLPLEHIVIMKFNSIDWYCNLHWEYKRKNIEDYPVWFELDMIAYSPLGKKESLRFLIECKYHDSSRFWFFHPCITLSHTSQHDALSARETLETNERFFNLHPYEILINPNNNSVFDLAPKSVWGVVVSQDGNKQDNAIHKGLNQLAYAYVPYVLDNYYHLCTNWADPIIPLLVTNAKIYRLKSTINEITLIENAESPEDIADNLDWTICYFAPNNELLDNNMDMLAEHDKKYKISKYPELENQTLNLWTSPSWVVIANIDSLPNTINTIYNHFLTLKKDYSYSIKLSEIMDNRRKSKTV